jgi:hypothetical protein
MESRRSPDPTPAACSTALKKPRKAAPSENTLLRKAALVAFAAAFWALPASSQRLCRLRFKESSERCSRLKYRLPEYYKFLSTLVLRIVLSSIQQAEIS